MERTEFLIGEFYHDFLSAVPFALQHPSPPLRTQALLGNECSAVEQRCDLPNPDLQVKCHLCESVWDRERLARMPNRSLDLAVTLEKGGIAAYSHLTTLRRLLTVRLLPSGLLVHSDIRLAAADLVRANLEFRAGMAARPRRSGCL